MTNTQKATRDFMREWMPYTGDREDRSEQLEAAVKTLLRTVLNDAKTRGIDCCEAISEVIEEFEHQ